MTTTMTQTLDQQEAARDSLRPLAERLQIISDAASDARVDTRALVMRPVDSFSTDTNVFENVTLIGRTPEGEMPLTVLEGAHDQIADRVGIPRQYYRRMLQTQPELLAENVNRWFTTEPDVRMLRLLTPIDAAGQERQARTQTVAAVRAVLGKTYRPLDHLAMLTAVMPTLVDVGAAVTEWSLDDTRMYLKLAQQPADLEAHMRNILGDRFRQGHTFLREVVGFGISIRNSETGHGAVKVEPMIQILRGTNLLVVTESLRVRHVGRGKGAADVNEDFMADDTRTLDDAATFLKIRDKVTEVFSLPTLDRITDTLAAGMNDLIQLPAAVPMMEFVGKIGKRFDLTDTETDILREEVAHEIGESHRPLTAFTVSQGFTALAKRTDRFERKDDLREIGWEVLKDGATKLLNAGAGRRN